MSQKISRSEQKRQFKQVEATAKELVELSNQELNRMPGSDELKSEVVAVRKTKAGARKRQIKYITKILNQESLDEIQSFLQQARGSKLKENRFQHEAEKFRDTIIDEALLAYDESRQFQKKWEIDWPSDAINHIIKKLPEIDEQELRSAAHQYARSRNKTYYRELFRIIRAAADKQRLSNMDRR